MVEPVAVVREVVRRYETGEPAGDLFDPEYRVVGTPAPTLPPAAGNDVDRRLTEMREGGLDARVREVTPGADGRVLLSSVWVHRSQTGGGSSFLVHAVMTVRDGRLTETRYFPARDDAWRFAEGG